jgi:serine/threonine-protein kinase
MKRSFTDGMTEDAFSFSDDGLAVVFQDALHLSDVPTPPDLVASMWLEDGFPYVPGLFVGRGGSGYVWKARHRETDEVVALKIIPFEGDASLARERWLREAEVTSTLSHPYILEIRDKGLLHEGKAAWIALEWIEGSDLQRKLAADGPLDWAILRPWMLTTCDGLATFHQSGLVHRDLKPSNLLLEEATGRLVISDFGAALPIEEDRVTRTSDALMSFGYSAPEQLRPGQEIDGRADQYSLATTLWELLTGELPMGSFPQLRSKAKNAPAWLDGVLRKAMSPAPKDRYPDIKAFANALTGAPARRRRRAMSVVGLVLISCLAFGFSQIKLPPAEAPKIKHFQSKALPVVEGVRVFVKLDITLQPDGLIKIIVMTFSDEALRGMKTQSAFALLDKHGKVHQIIVNPNFGVTGRILLGNGSSRTDYTEAKIPEEMARRITDVRYLTHPAGDQPNSPWYRDYPDVPKQDVKSLISIREDDHVGNPKSGIPEKFVPNPPVD